MECESCGVDLWMSGSKLCRVCDPDIDAIIAGNVKSKTPNLCDHCYEKHLKEHNEKK